MDFDLTDEQTALRDMVRGLLGRAYTAEQVRHVAETQRGWSQDVWAALRDCGVLGLTIPHEYGGAGAGPVEAAVVMAEIGRVLAPEPVLAGAFVPAELVARAGDEAQRKQYLSGIAAGEAIGAFAHEEAGDRWPKRAVGATARRVGDGYVLSGAKERVRSGDCATFYVVSARLDGQVRLFVVDGQGGGVRRMPYRGHDRRRGAHLMFDDAAGELLVGAPVDEALQYVEIFEQAALCAEAVGAMEEALRLTVQYLRTRKQFGVPLSSFQALAHRAADLYLLVELARSMSLYATAVLQDGIVDPIVASRAKLQVCRSARAIGHETIHLHGGVGVTDEFAIGHYASRLMAIEHTLGGADEHLSLLAAALNADEMVSVGAPSGTSGAGTTAQHSLGAPV